MAQQEKRDGRIDEMRGVETDTGEPLASPGTQKNSRATARTSRPSPNKKFNRKSLTNEEKIESRIFSDFVANERAFTNLSIQDIASVSKSVRVAFEKYIIEKRRKSVLSNPEMSFSGERDFIEAIESYARRSADSLPHGRGVADALGSFLKAHFARARAQETPPVPERKYVPRQDEIIPFLREVWGEWLAGGHLARQTLYDHDPAAYSALSNWLRNNELPDDMDIPSNREITDRELENEWFHRDDVPRIASAIGRRARFPR